MVVPLLASQEVFSNSLPPFICIRVLTLSLVVFNTTSDITAIDGRASPLKPRVFILNKSSSFSNLDVACLWKAKIASSLSIPIPLSITFISFNPDSFKYIFISSLPASMLFSTSSLTIETHFSTTSPALILLASISFITLILLINYTTY